MPSSPEVKRLETEISQKEKEQGRIATEIKKLKAQIKSIQDECPHSDGLKTVREADTCESRLAYYCKICGKFMGYG